MQLVRRASVRGRSEDGTQYRQVRFPKRLHYFTSWKRKLVFELLSNSLAAFLLEIMLLRKKFPKTIQGRLMDNICTNGTEWWWWWAHRHCMQSAIMLCTHAMGVCMLFVCGRQPAACSSAKTKGSKSGFEGLPSNWVYSARQKYFPPLRFLWAMFARSLPSCNLAKGPLRWLRLTNIPGYTHFSPQWETLFINDCHHWSHHGLIK